MHTRDLGHAATVLTIFYQGRDHPGTQVLGIDLSPIQPDYAPPNVSFEICDAEDEWSFSQKFDFIHMRAIVTCFADPKAVFQQAYDALEPGGYIELRDPIMPFQFLTPPPEGCALQEWGERVIEAADAVGRRWTNAPHYARWLQEIGFVDIVETREHVGLNPWMKGSRNKQLAALLGSDMSHGLESMSMALFTRVLGWDPARVRELVERARNDIVDPKIHAYSEGYVSSLTPSPRLLCLVYLADTLLTWTYSVHVYGMKPYNAV